MHKDNDASAVLEIVVIKVIDKLSAPGMASAKYAYGTQT